MNPYNDDFTCKGGPPGKCAPTADIYGEVVGLKKPATQTDIVQQSGLPVLSAPSTNESAYREAEMAKAARLLKQPITPVIVPPLVMRVLILPYQGEGGELNMMRYAYIMADKPRWVMGDYLVKQQEE